MTAAPVAPGRGLPVYQPATAVLAGTCSVPLELRPRCTRLVRTPMAGMVSDTGSAVRCTVVSQTGVTVRPVGAGTGLGLAGRRTSGPAERLATTTPAVPAPTASSPSPSSEAASTRRYEPRGRGAPADRRTPRPAGRRTPRSAGRRTALSAGR